MINIKYQSSNYAWLERNRVKIADKNKELQEYCQSLESLEANTDVRI